MHVFTSPAVPNTIPTRYSMCPTHLPTSPRQVRAEPKKLPTAKICERFVCQWEQLGLPCPADPDHFVRNSHQVCAFCWVIGHTLVRCPIAKKEGLAFT